MSPDPPRARVVEVTSRYVLAGAAVDEGALDEMLEQGVQALARTRTPADGWQAIIGRAQRIAVKFNHVGARVLATNEPLARVIVRALGKAGYDPKRVALIEVPQRLALDLRTRPPAEGWGAAIAVGDSSDEVANYLYEADAVINVALLKTHRIAGFSGAMKNISHAAIRHPARYHGNGCAPYVGQVIANKEVSSRLKLNLVNALRVVVRNGPDARQEDTCDLGGLILGFDPVAVDAAGYELLLRQREQRGIGGVIPARYLEAAAASGVGRRAAHELSFVPIRHGS